MSRKNTSAQWKTDRAARTKYSTTKNRMHHENPLDIKNAKDLDDAVARGAHAWPGGYPIYFIAADGEPLSFEAVEKNMTLCRAAWHRHSTNSQNSEISEWRIVSTQINWEDDSLFCSHSGERIPSAYGNDEDDTATRRRYETQK